VPLQSLRSYRKFVDEMPARESLSPRCLLFKLDPADPTLGISNRIWLALGGIVGLFTLSRLLAGPATPSSLYSKHQYLSPQDYLNASTSDPAPFDFCPVFGPGDEIAERRGQWSLLRSRVHTGSGARIQRVVQKAMAGDPITISVLGGSGGYS
jgi:hypothetical protein